MYVVHVICRNKLFLVNFDHKKTATLIKYPVRS